MRGLLHPGKRHPRVQQKDSLDALSSQMRTAKRLLGCAEQPDVESDVVRETRGGSNPVRGRLDSLDSLSSTAV